jgi:hypothetical protein
VQIGWLKNLEALVGEKGKLAIPKARQQYQALEGALAAEKA